ncbi:hypothetical protein [Glycomyces artemisiae]|uniref:Uncharacterized protein n=1 Tax=Glycomyces artemisiae TaxID=1076443 RepID=A0A2T0U6L7_9ACTN|nr:hypothetical protein [Glycomyces artemisiae]PRY53508.1 hypothetical protein B0I28_1177 [Glycomyces artemisiae]
MSSQNNTTTTEAREGQDHVATGPVTLVPDLGVTAADDHHASLQLFDLRGTDQVVAAVRCACGWRRQSDHPRAAVEGVDPAEGPWVEPWERHVARAIGLDVIDDRGIECSRITFGRYPGQEEILAKWQWGISRDGTPITAGARDGVAMDLAFKFAAERDRALQLLDEATEAAHGQLGITRTELDALRTGADELRRDLTAAQDDYKAAVAQWHNADALLDEARADLAAERKHTDCATVDDLERTKADLATAETARGKALAAAGNLRLQRTVIIACASAIVLVLVIALVVTGGSGS